MLLANMDVCDACQNVDVPTHEYSVVLTTLLHEHSVHLGWTAPIFKLGLHFNLNYTPVNL